VAIIINRGQIAVMTSPEQLTGHAPLALKMHWFYWGRLSVRRKYFTYYVVHRLRHIQPSRSLTRYLGPVSNVPPTLTWPICSGFRQVFQSRTAAWGETCVFARTSCLFGFSGKHTLPPERSLVTLWLSWLCLSSELLIGLVLCFRHNSSPSATKTAILGPPWHYGWQKLSGVQSKLTIAACLVPRVFGSTHWDWLFALPITSCGLRLDDEAVRVAVGLPLGLHLCVPHQCRCGSAVDARGLHSFVCKRAPCKTSGHHALNDLVAHAFASAGIPATKEPHGLTRSDGERSDGLTLVPWQRGKPLSWDVTVICPLADSYVELAAQEAGSAAELAATRKLARYSALGPSITSSPLQWRHWVLWMNRHANISTSSAGKLVTTQATIGRLAFCFNGFLFWFSVSTRFC